MKNPLQKLRPLYAEYGGVSTIRLITGTGMPPSDVSNKVVPYLKRALAEAGTGVQHISFVDEGGVRNFDVEYVDHVTGKTVATFLQIVNPAYRTIAFVTIRHDKVGVVTVNFELIGGEPMKNNHSSDKLRRTDRAIVEVLSFERRIRGNVRFRLQKEARGEKAQAIILRAAHSLGLYLYAVPELSSL